MALRSRSPYAPQRQPLGIDWEAERAATARASAERARIDELGRKAREDHLAEADPISQLVKRCHASDLRMEGIERRQTRLEEQLQTIIDLLKGGSG